MHLGVTAVGTVLSSFLTVRGPYMTMPSREDARRARAEKLIEQFPAIENATDSVTGEAEKRAARQVIAPLERVLTPQMELF
jgi:hypothetical protein